MDNCTLNVIGIYTKDNKEFHRVIIIIIIV